MPKPKIVQFEFGTGGVLVVLYDDGRMFQRTTDPKDFANRPNHVPGFIWTEIKGPLAE